MANFKSSVPKHLYHNINNKAYTVAPFTLIEPTQENTEQKDLIAEKPIAKPGFKPMFRKKEV